MSVSYARQNMIGDKLVGLPSVHYHLKNLYNKILKQASTINKNVKDHNDTQTNKLKKIKDTEYSKHEEERKSSREQNIELPADFEIAYETKVKNIVDVFWTKNRAEQVDPINVFEILKKISDWIDTFEKNKEMQINKANNSEPTFNYNLTELKVNNENDTHISLEELYNLIQDKNKEILDLIDRFVIVSWKIGNGDTVDQLVHSANENYNLILNSIQTYGSMQKTFKIVSTFENTNYINPMTKLPMSAVDMADYKNIVIPVVERMLAIVENQKKTANAHIKSVEPSVRSDVIKLLEGSMNGASSRPTTDKIKEYTNGLMESMMPKIIISPDIERHLENYQKLLDEFDSQIKPVMSTVNANTRVKVIWNNPKIDNPINSWNTIDKMTNYQQSEFTECVSVYANEWTTDTTWETSDIPNIYTNQNHKTSTRGRGRGRGKNNNAW